MGMPARKEWKIVSSYGGNLANLAPLYPKYHKSLCITGYIGVGKGLGLRFRFQGSGFRVQSVGFKACG